MADPLKEAQEKARTKIHTPSETKPYSSFGTNARLGESRKPRLSTVGLLFIAGVLALISLWMNRPAQYSADSTALQTVPAAVEPAVLKENLPEAPKKAGLVLKGVAVGGGVPYAMVNEEILSVGDKIGDYTVSSIEDTYIVVEDASGASKRLKVPHPELP